MFIKIEGKEIEFTVIKDNGATHIFINGTNLDPDEIIHNTTGIFEICSWGSESNAFFFGGVDKLPETMEEYNDMISEADYDTSYTAYVELAGMNQDDVLDYLPW